MRYRRARFSSFSFSVALIFLLGAVSLWAGAEAVWSYVPGGELSGPPAYTRHGLVLFAAEDRWLYALDAHGELRWRYDLRRRPITGPAVARDGVIYLGLHPNRIIALTPTGRLRWSSAGYGLPLGVIPAPGGVVYAVYSGGEVSAHTPRGGLLWRQRLPYTLTGAPVLSGAGELVVAAEDGRLIAVNRSGTSVWTYRHDRGITALVALGRGELRFGDSAGTVAALSQDGRLLWSARALVQPIISLHADSAGGLLLVAADGALARVAVTGTVRWAVRPPGVGASAAALSGGGTTYAVTADGRLLVLDSDGRLLADRAGARGNPYAYIALTPGGRLLTGGRDWVVDLIVPQYPAASSGADGLGQWSNLRGDAASTAVAAGYRGPTPADYRNQIDFIYLSALVRSEMPSERERALREIEQRVAEQRVDGSYAYLVELTLQLTATPRVSPGGWHLTALEEQRVRALKVLAQLGDIDSIGRLARLLLSEPSSSARVALIEALGGIESDPDGVATAAIAAALRRAAVSPVEGYAAARALYAIARFNPPPVGAQATDAIAWIASQPRFVSGVRSSAYDYLRRLE